MARTIARVADDVRSAARAVVRQPRFSLLLVLILALGIGASVTVFTLVDQTLLRPAPFRDGDRLVDILDVRRGGGGGNSLSPEKILGWQEETSVFERFEAYAPRTFDLSTGPVAERVPGLVVSSDVFDMLGVLPIAGRVFAAGEGHPGDPVVVVLSERLVRRHGWSPPDVVGRAVTVNDSPATVVGVLPARFSLLNTEVVWMAMDLSAHRGSPSAAGLFGIGRLRPGLSVPDAQARVYAIADHRQAMEPLPRTWDLRLDPKRAASVTATTRTALLALLAATGSLLLLTCANVALLLLTRTAAREAELAVCSAMGASRGRLLFHELLQTTLLALTGGAGGLLLAVWAIRLVVTFAPTNLVSLGTVPIAVDPRIALVALLGSGAVALACGLLPAWRSSVVGIDVFLRQAGSTPTSRGERWSLALLAVQVAASVTLLTGAALTARTITAIASTPLGFEPRGLMTMRVDLAVDWYPTTTARETFLGTVDERLRQVAGIRDVAFARGLTLAGFALGTLEADGGTREDDTVVMGTNVVSPSFFRTIRLPLIEGRTFTDRDQASHVIINRALARRLWPDASAVGRRFRTDQGEAAGWKQVVGVVGDMDSRISSDRPLRYQVYAPWPPGGPAGVGVAGQRSYVPHMLLVRAEHPETVPRLVQDIVRSLDPQQPVERIVAADEAVQTVFAREFFVQRILVAFAAFGLVLAATGVFGVMSQTTRSRSRELAIRMAVGASPRHLCSALLPRMLAFAALGIGAGLAGGAALGRVLGALLHGVSPLDPASLLLATLALASTGVVAGWWPLRRALRTDPAITLRAER